MMTWEQWYLINQSYVITRKRAADVQMDPARPIILANVVKLHDTLDTPPPKNGNMFKAT